MIIRIVILYKTHLNYKKLIIKNVIFHILLIIGQINEWFHKVKKTL